MKCLYLVTYGCILATHGASQRCRKGRTSQPCTNVAPAIQSSAGRCREYGPRPPYFPPPSLSISPTSRAIETGRSRHQCQDRVHGEAFRKARRTFAFPCQQERVIAERYCEPGIGGVPSAEGGAWVNDHEVGATRWSWNIGLIVCYRQSWSRSMNCWYRINDGRFQRQRTRRR
jgi:hypothetical protein